MSRKFNDNDQTKLYRADASDDQPTFQSRPYPQQQQQYQNGRPAGYPYQQQNYQQGAYPQQPVRPQQQNIYAPPQYQQQYQQQPQYRQPAAQYPHRSSDKKKSKGGSGIIVLIVITLILILAVVGVGIYMYISNNSSGGSKNSSSEKDNAAVTADAQKPDDSEEPTDEEDRSAIIVPDLRGYDYLTAESVLSQSGLKCETEYTFSDSVNENIVISQSIPAGTEAEENTVVKIVVSQGKAQAEKVIVPNVTGLDYDAACRELEKAKLNPSAVYTPHDKVAKDIVISQDIVPGTEVFAGTGIVLSVSQGKDAQQATAPPADSNNDSGKYGIVNTEETDLNVRKTPSTDGDKLGTLPKGTKVEIVGSEGNWYKIVYNGGFGYVSKDYVKLS